MTTRGTSERARLRAESWVTGTRDRANWEKTKDRNENPKPALMTAGVLLTSKRFLEVPTFDAIRHPLTTENQRIPSSRTLTSHNRCPISHHVSRSTQN